MDLRMCKQRKGIVAYSLISISEEKLCSEAMKIFYCNNIDESKPIDFAYNHVNKNVYMYSYKCNFVTDIHLHINLFLHCAKYITHIFPVLSHQI